MAKYKFFDGTSWVELAKKSDIPSLAGYAITDEVVLRLNWWNVNDFSKSANDMLSGITFAYSQSHNTPDTGTIATFSCKNDLNYPLQIQGGYGSNSLWWRTRNGDNGTWNSWNECASKGDLGNYVALTQASNRLITSTGTDTPIYLKGNSSATYIGFHNSSGTVLGWYGVSSSNKPVFLSGVSGATETKIMTALDFSFSNGVLTITTT